VYSGVLAEAELNSVLREDAFHGEARIYQDGLETADVAEDCTFAVWIRNLVERFPTSAHPANSMSAFITTTITLHPSSESLPRNLYFFERDQRYAQRSD
jgi:hypothetical protein